MPRPKIGDHTLREPAQSKFTSTSHNKSHFMRKFKRKMPQTKTGEHTRAIFCGNLKGKMPDSRTAAQTLCEPAQSKCSWTLHKSHFMRKLTGKMPRTNLEHHDQAPAFTCCQAAVSWPGWCWLSAPWICGTAPENPWLPGTNQAPNPKDKPKDHQGGNLMKLS